LRFGFCLEFGFWSLELDLLGCRRHAPFACLRYAVFHLTISLLGIWILGFIWNLSAAGGLEFGFYLDFGLWNLTYWGIVVERPEFSGFAVHWPFGGDFGTVIALEQFPVPAPVDLLLKEE
jgi:hypothetical protein